MPFNPFAITPPLKKILDEGAAADRRSDEQARRQASSAAHPAPVAPVPDYQPTQERGWLPLSAHVYPGARIYVGAGPQKAYLADVADVDDNHIEPDGTRFRGILLRYPSGGHEWKDRDAFRAAGVYFIWSTDPALPR